MNEITVCLMFAYTIVILIFLTANTGGLIWLAYRHREKCRDVTNLKKIMAEMDKRLVKVEDWSAENPILLLVRADIWIEEIRRGSSRVGLQEQVFPALQRVCESTDTQYWLVQVGRKLKKVEHLIRARNSHNEEDLLEEIERMTSEFDIDLSAI